MNRTRAKCLLAAMAGLVCVTAWAVSPSADKPKIVVGDKWQFIVPK